VLHSVTTKQFEKDIKLAKKRGKNLDKIKTVMLLLLQGKKLPHNNYDHVLSGNYKSRRECHIEPDCLLIYKPSAKEIVFERTGTHSDLFK
jgi:mRNA interferase YafQ